MRSMMAADVNPYHNELIPADVNEDMQFSPLDALIIVNQLNSSGARSLLASGQDPATGAAGESDFKVDVDNDQWLTPTDALRLINLLNGEGENEVVQFTLSATKVDGSALPTSGGVITIGQGEKFLVQVRTKDLRTSPQGVAAAYMDLTYTAGLMQVNMRENQLITFNGPPSGGTFTLTVTNPSTNVTRTTGNITYDPFDASATRSAIRNALVALDNVDTGEVTVEAPPISAGLDESSNVVVRFGGTFSNTNVANMTANGAGLSGGSISVSELSGTNAADADDYLKSFTFGTRFRDVISANNGDGTTANMIDEVGASNFVRTFGQELLVYEFEATGLSGGSLAMLTSAADVLPAHNVLLHGQNTAIPPAEVLYGGLNMNIQSFITANDDTATVAEDTSGGVLINVLSNDSSQNGTKTLVSASTPANGTTAIVSGQVRYTPNANFPGANASLVDSFTYVVSDGAGHTATATVSVTVTAVNDAPVNALPAGAQSTNEDTAKTFSSANSNAISVSDIDAGTANIVVTLTPSNGTLALVNGAGVTVSGGGASPLVLTGSQSAINTALGSGVTFTPSNNFPTTGASGTATIVVNTNDQGNTGTGGSLQDTDTLTITVNAQNDAPVNGLPSNPQTDEGVNLVFSSANGNAFSVSDVDAGTGSLQVNLALSAGSGTLTFASTTGLTVQNNGTSSVTVTGTLASLTAAFNAGVTYAPATNFAGTATLTMTTSDQGNTGAGGAKTDVDSVDIDVQALVRPRANTDRFTIAEDSADTASPNPLNVLANDIPNVGATLVLISFDATGTQGTVTQDGNNFRFAPNPDFYGVTTFTYTINDSSGQGVNSVGTVTITVSEKNDAPTTTADTKSAVEDTALTFPASDLVANDSVGPANELTPPTGFSAQSLTVTAVSASSAKGGAVVLNGNGTITYTPPANYNNLVSGPDTFTYTARDNGTTAGVSDFLTAQGTVTVNISEVNDAPVVTASLSRTAVEDTALGITISNLLTSFGPGGGTDEATQVLSLASFSATSVQGGTLSSNGTTLTYTPAANFNGADSFTVTVADDGTTNGAANSKSVTATVNVTVSEVNDAPTANDDSVTAVSNVSTNFQPAQLLANDSRGPSNESAQSLSIASVVSPTAQGGTVVLNGDGSVTYTPAAGYQGPDSFQYRARDNGTTNGAADPQTSNLATVTINVLNYIPMTISGHVYFDLDNDGLMESGESGIAGVEVTMTGTDSVLNQPISAITVVTDRNGFYEFTNVAPGDYRIAAIQAANTIDGMDTPQGRLTNSGNDRFAFVVTIQENVGLANHTFANNNFGERSLQASFLSMNYLLASAQDGTTTTSDFPDGVLFSFADGGTNLDWYLFKDGFAGYDLVSFQLAGNHASGVLRVRDSQGRIFETTVTEASARLRLRSDSTGRTMAYVVGEYGDFSWNQIAFNPSAGGGEGEGEGEAVDPAELLESAQSAEMYAACVDAAFEDLA